MSLETSTVRASGQEAVSLDSSFTGEENHLIEALPEE